MNFILSIRYINRYDICNIVFIHSSGDGNLGCFNVLATVNNAAVNVGEQKNKGSETKEADRAGVFRALWTAASHAFMCM